MLVVTRFLFLCAAVLALPAIVAAQTLPLTIERIWTRDGGGTDKPSFTPGDAIQYTTIINNSTTSNQVMEITFTATGPVKTPGYAKDIFFYRQDNVAVPPGLTSYYSPSTVPRGIEGGVYAVGIGIKIHQPGSPGFGNSDLFTVTPVAGLTIPSSGTIMELFLDTRFSPVETPWYHRYYDQSNVLHDLVSGAHSGIDISNNVNDCDEQSSPVYAAGPGTVIWAGWTEALGWSVVIKHGYGLMGNRHYTYSLYGHMGTYGTTATQSHSCLRVAVGWPAYTNTLLGYQGSSGLANSATHVHFMVFAGDQDVTTLLSPYELVNKYSTYPASHDLYTCMQLTLGDKTPETHVERGHTLCTNSLSSVRG